MSQDTQKLSSADGQLGPKERKKRYKQSLNLPRTSFPMRANLVQNEPAARKRWQKMDLYARMQKAKQGRPPFVFHDGPPYANGSIHVGHLLNKVLKDLVVRSQNMLDNQCSFVPGWDCHGLPIEHKVMTGLVESGKISRLQDLEPDQRRMAIRRECARYAAKYQRLQTDQMQRLLTVADYSDPYLTMKPRYEKEVLEVFVDLLKQGLVYRALKPVHWSIANQTALADAELEYREREDPSVYVEFEVTAATPIAKIFPTLDGISSWSLLIWTTTPWTLPANVLIAIHERHRYSLVDISGERATVIATDLVEPVMKISGHETWTVLAEVAGSELVGVHYQHPFCDRQGVIVGADYVTLEDGTGLVHTAPGHGEDDYLTGVREGLDVYCPVRGDGTFDETVPEWIQGKTVWEANPLVTESLEASGHMFHQHQFRHSYPHDWRSKTPVIFRSTEQWFIAVDQPTKREGRSLREMALAASDDSIEFVPSWGRKRLRGMLESRPDWCISRQRSWGLPIPAFRLPNGELLLTSASVSAIAKGVFGQTGSDAWFTLGPEQLLEHYDPTSDPDAPEGFEIASLAKTYDIFDVWFESGSSWNAVMRRRDLGYPIDLYLEGSDQHRGWFQLSLLPALGATGQSPFRTLLTHGFVVDKDGKKMSKSEGNALSVEDLVNDFGADVCRWWVSSLAFENDIKVDLSYFGVASESYRKVRNTLRFLLGNLQDFTPDLAVDLESLAPTSLEAYVVGEGHKLRDKVATGFRTYSFRSCHLALFDFCNETLSAFYLDAIKDRLYCDRPDSPRRRRAQTAMWQLSELLATLLAPILPHTAEEIWQALPGRIDADEEAGTVHDGVFHELPKVEPDVSWADLLQSRSEVKRMLEAAKERGIDNPLDAGLRLPDPDQRFAPFQEDLADLMGVSRVELIATSEIDRPEVFDLREQPRCERSWRRDSTVAERSDGGWLSDRDAEAAGLI